MNTYETATVNNWTQSAVYCYKRGCICEGCYYDKFFKETQQEYAESPVAYKRICRMKEAVLSLVQKFGAPTDRDKILAEIPKDVVVKLYVTQKNPLQEIYEILQVTKDEFDYLLDKYHIARRKRYKRFKHKPI